MTKRNSTDTSEWLADLEFLPVLQGLCLTLFLFILFSLFLAIAVYFSSWQPSPRMLTFLIYASVIGGTVWSGRTAKRKAFLHGIVMGVLGFLVLGWLGNRALFFSWLWWKGLMRMSLLAMLGGILGGLMKE